MTYLSSRIPALDGLRGAAIAAVMLFHFTRWQPDTVPGALFCVVARMGWVGVDLFFVLSGFLITGILLDSKGAPGYFRIFYVRRALRIFPLYYAVIIAIWVFGPVIFPRDIGSAATFEHYRVWYLTYTTNWIPIVDGYSIGPYRTGHFWSLAIEEQFYLVWPALVFIFSARSLVRVCAAVLVLSPLIRILASSYLPAIAIYSATALRADSLVAGAVVAILFRTEDGRVLLARFAKPAMWVAGGISLALFVVEAGRTSYLMPLHNTVGYSALALLFAAVLARLIQARDTSSARRLFESAPLRRLGEISYGVYVFHWPVVGALFYVMQGHSDRLVLESGPLGQLAFYLIAFSVTISLALLSWRFLEQPLLRLKDRVSYPAGASTRSTATTPTPSPVVFE